MLNCSAEELKQMIKKHPDSIDPLLLSKARHAIKVLTWDTDRVHILDGRIDGCLLIEIFDKVGLGTMIHANEYDRIRQAVTDDVADIYALVKQASREKPSGPSFGWQKSKKGFKILMFTKWTKASSVAHVWSHTIKTSQNSQCLRTTLSPKQRNRKKLTQYTIEQAKHRGFQKIIALSTQASEFFTEHLGFTQSSAEALPSARRMTYESSQRNSIVLERIL